jgi:ribose transport system substrate-binding protein
MKRLRIFTGLALIAALVLSLAGCGGENKEQGADTKDKVVIGFSQVTLDSPFYVSLMDAAKEEAEARGAELIYVDAQNDIEKQNNDVQDLITKGIDVLILNPSNPTGVNPALKAAEQAGIKVVTVDRPTETKVATFVGRDNKKMGEIAGEEAVKLLGGKGLAKGKIIEIQGDAGGKVMMDRRDGFHAVVEQEPGIEIVQGPYCDYTRSKAVKAFQDLLQAHPDVDLVYAHNDDMALGALQVLQQNGLAGKVKIVGIDGLMEAIKAIDNGNYNATVLNDPQLLGKMVVDTALGVLEGKEYPEFIDAGTGLINQDNAAQYINDELVFAAAQE